MMWLWLPDKYIMDGWKWGYIIGCIMCCCGQWAPSGTADMLKLLGVRFIGPSTTPTCDNNGFVNSQPNSGPPGGHIPGRQFNWAIEWACKNIKDSSLHIQWQFYRHILACCIGIPRVGAIDGKPWDGADVRSQAEALFTGPAALREGGGYPGWGGSWCPGLG